MKKNELLIEILEHNKTKIKYIILLKDYIKLMKKFANTKKRLLKP